MLDFSVSIYKELLTALQSAKYHFITFEDYCRGNIPAGKWIILRHDVDDKKLNSLAFAEIQNEMGIKGSYYFRMVPESFDPEVISDVFDLGHEIGYHYEDMDFAKGDRSKAVKLFEKHLQQLRDIVPIHTICMHGSPKSAYDNKDVWKDYNYRDFEIIGEPYFDIDFNAVFYITDTGRMWDGFKVSVRDKVKTEINWPVYHTTKDVIKAIQDGNFPDKVMMNFHPQRWNENFAVWFKELMVQKAKNEVKRIIVKSKK
ncbi:MAG: hypothetical protein JJU02_12340 [Cryomorphaceae bacterium]|nr:hypothetical protein [Cryomorphaceae bacterium]